MLAERGSKIVNLIIPMAVNKEAKNQFQALKNFISTSPQTGLRNFGFKIEDYLVNLDNFQINK